MLSIPDMAIIGVVALMVFGPDQLPKVARRAGQIVRDVQNTSQSFIREMERAADDPVAPAPTSLAHTDVQTIEGEATALATDDVMYADTYAETTEMEAGLDPPRHSADVFEAPTYTAAPAYHEIPTPPAPSLPG